MAVAFCLPNGRSSPYKVAVDNFQNPQGFQQVPTKVAVVYFSSFRTGGGLL